MVSSTAGYLSFLLLLGLERCAEILLSRRNAAWAFSQGAREVGARHYPVMAAMHAAFLVACATEVILLHRPWIRALAPSALGVSLLAQALRYWAIATLGKRWNTRIIVLSHAAPITAGPYRFVRHPTTWRWWRSLPRYRSFTTRG